MALTVCETTDVRITVNIGPIDAASRFSDLPRIATSATASSLKDSGGGSGALRIFAIIATEDGSDPVGHVDVPPRPTTEPLLATNKHARPRGLPSVGLAALVSQQRLSQAIPMRHTRDSRQALGAHTR